MSDVILTAEQKQCRDEWLSRVRSLVADVENWGKESGWSTRRIETELEDTEIGPLTVPALLLQKETARALLEPIARSAPGVDGVVDLYIMPAYDDVATLYFRDGRWQVNYNFPAMAHDESKPLSKETFRGILDEMNKNAAATV